MNIISLCSLCGMPSEAHPHPGCNLFTTAISSPWPVAGADFVARQRIDVLERDYIHKDTLEAILKPLRDRVDELARRDTWLGEIEDARDSLAKDLCVMEVKLKQAEAAEIKYRDMWHSAEARVRALEEVAAASAVILGEQGRKDCHADDPTAACWPYKRLRRALEAAGVK